MNAPKARTDKKRRDENELEFILATETNRRTRMIMKRDNISEELARSKACEWILSETGNSQLDLPIDLIDRHVYRVYYRRFNDDRHSEYRELNVVAKGVLHSWLSTNEILADIIRDRFDDKCDHVVVFHQTKEHDYEFPPESSTSNVKEENEIERRRKIRDLEKQIEQLKKQ